MREFVEGDDEHFEGPEGVAQVGQVPEEGDDDDVGDDHAEGDLLGGCYVEAAAAEELLVLGVVGYGGGGQGVLVEVGWEGEV